MEAPTSVTAEKSERLAIVIKDPDSFLTYLADVLERITLALLHTIRRDDWRLRYLHHV